LVQENGKMANFGDEVHFGDLAIAKRMLDHHPKMEL
jgi:hypothetical protein